MAKKSIEQKAQDTINRGLQRYIDPNTTKFKLLTTKEQVKEYDKMVKALNARLRGLEKANVQHISKAYQDIKASGRITSTKTKQVGFKRTYTEKQAENNKAVFLSEIKSLYRYLGQKSTLAAYTKETKAKEEKRLGIQFEDENVRSKYWRFIDLLKEKNLVDNMGSPETQEIVTQIFEKYNPSVGGFKRVIDNIANRNPLEEYEYLQENHKGYEYELTKLLFNKKSTTIRKVEDSLFSEDDL